MMRPRIKKICLCFLALVLTMLPVSSWNDNTQYKTNTFSINSDTNDVVLTKRGVDQDHVIVDAGLEGAVFDLYAITPKGPKKIETDLISDRNGEIWHRSLEVGSYYFEEVRLPAGYDYDRDASNQTIRKHHFEIKKASETDNIVYVDVENIKKEATLALTKTIVSDQALTQEQKDLMFSFKLQFLDMDLKNPLTYTINGSQPLTMLNGGELTLKHGDKAVFTHLEFGTRYQITETDSKGYRITSNNNSGILKETNTVAFFNHDINSKSGEVSVKKIVMNEDGSPLTPLQKDQKFTFKVSFDDAPSHEVLLADGTKHVLKSGQTIAQAHEESFTILGLKGGAAFEIEELLRDKDYTTAMRVIQGTVSNGAELQHFEVVNVKKSSDSSLKTNDLKVSKQVVGMSAEAIGKDLFTFKVDFEAIKGQVEYSINGGKTIMFTPGDSVTLKAKDILTFKKLPIGVRFKVEEMEAEGYQSLVKVIEGTITSGSNRADFINEHHPLNRNVTISKVVENTKTNQVFKFHLKYQHKDIVFTLQHGESKVFSLPIGTEFKVTEEDYRDQGYVLTIENGQATVGDHDIVVKATNVYHQNLVMDTIKGTVRWIINDKYKDEIPKSVSLDVFDDAGKKVTSIEVMGKGNLWNYEVALPRYNAEGKVINYTVTQNDLQYFKTTYDGLHVTNQFFKNTSYRPQVTKKLEGKPLPTMNTLFEFKIKAIDGAPLQRDNAAILNGEGTTKFLAIDFDKAGVYHYTIQEVEGRETKILYDKHILELVIEVVDEKGVLKVQKATYLRGEQAIDSAEFTNTVIDDGAENPGGTPGETPGGTPEPNPGDKPQQKPPKPDKPGGLPHTGVKPSIVGKLGYMMIGLGVVFHLANCIKKKHRRKRNR